MNTPLPPSPDAELTPEERALAGHIARTRPPREPSQALDARILAAARAAAAPGRANIPARRRARRHWPAVTAVAATLMLAVGIAWQLRPVDEVRVEYSEAPSAAARVVAPPRGPQASDDRRQADVDTAVAADEAAAAASDAPPPEAEASAPAKPAPQSTPLPVPEPAESRQPEAAVERRAAPARAGAEAPLVFDQPSPMDIAPASEPRPAAFPATAATPLPSAPSAPAPAAPAPPPPPPAPMRAKAISTPAADAAAAREAFRASRARRESKPVPAPSAGISTATAIGTTVSDGEKAMATPEADTGELDRIEVTGTRLHDFADQPLDDQPPASTDSPQVQRAWLQRVRELVAKGDLDAARESLRVYRHRYPHAVLPDDLRALLDE